MNDVIKELQSIVVDLQAVQRSFDSPSIKRLLSALEQQANEIGKGWSGSWVGFESRVYYAGLKQPPPGAYFSGGQSSYFNERNSAGTWSEYGGGVVEAEIFLRAGKPTLTNARRLSHNCLKHFEANKELVISILQGLIVTTSDPYFSTLLADTEAITTSTASQFAAAFRPKQLTVSALSPAAQQGIQTPPHFKVRCDILALKCPAFACVQLAKVTRRTFSHLERTWQKTQQSSKMRTKVFIGHGHSHSWMILRDFVSGRLKLPWDEFNRVPVAGTTNIARLSEMLDAAAIAFIVMTAEDEQTDGSVRARMNVVHEAGLFQGRLGFAKAIILLEDGCEEFSNISGLGQIRFTKNRMEGAFEELRKVLEREGLISE